MAETAETAGTVNLLFALHSVCIALNSKLAWGIHSCIRLRVRVADRVEIVHVVARLAVAPRPEAHVTPAERAPHSIA